MFHFSQIGTAGNLSFPYRRQRRRKWFHLSWPAGPQPWGKISYWYQDQWMPTYAIRIYDANGDGVQDGVFEGDLIGGAAQFALELAVIR